jgi:hypothetical protein
MTLDLNFGGHNMAAVSATADCRVRRRTAHIRMFLKRAWPLRLRRRSVKRNGRAGRASVPHRTGVGAAAGMPERGKSGFATVSANYIRPSARNGKQGCRRGGGGAARGRKGRRSEQEQASIHLDWDYLSGSAAQSKPPRRAKKTPAGGRGRRRGFRVETDGQCACLPNVIQAQIMSTSHEHWSNVRLRGVVRPSPCYERVRKSGECSRGE